VFVTLAAIMQCLELDIHFVRFVLEVGSQGSTSRSGEGIWQS
jgi:hypothetical protein